MEMKPGYKQTDFGVIPEEWDVRTVSSMGEVRAGKALASRGPGRLRPYLRTKNVFEGRIDLDDVLEMPMTDADFSRYRLRHGDVLLNEGQSIELVGRCAIYRDEYPEPCAIQNQLVRFRAREGVSAEFATHLFRFCQLSGVFSKIAMQTTSVAHLGVGRFQRLQLAWPHETIEQEAIAGVLNDSDTLIELLEQLIAKKRDLKHAAMQQLLTCDTRLPGFRGDWGVTTLSQLGATFGGLTAKTKVDFGHGSSRYITFLNIMNNVVIKTDQFERVQVRSTEQQNAVSKGDLFFNGSSETPEEVGMCAVLLEDVCGVFLNSFCFGFRLRDDDVASGLYLAYFFRSDEGRKLLYALAQGATRHNLSKTALLEIEFPLPSFPEQTAIAGVLSDMDAELVVLEERCNKSRDLKQAMMQELLFGKTRLVSVST